jgi:hypothetical protein
VQGDPDYRLTFDETIYELAYVLSLKPEILSKIVKDADGVKEEDSDVKTLEE